MYKYIRKLLKGSHVAISSFPFSLEYYKTYFKRSLMLQKKKLCIKGSPKWKNMIFKQNKKNIHTFILFKSFRALALNAWFLLLEHQWAFESSVIVAYESLSCPRCEKMDLKIRHCLKGFKYTKNAGKTKILWDLKDFSEEQQTVYLFVTNKGLMSNYHLTKKQLWIIQVTTPY